MGKPSFNDHVVKTLTKAQFIQQHPDHGDYWDKVNKAEPEQKRVKPVKKVN